MPDSNAGVITPPRGDFSGLVAVVTGGSSGVGAATAALLAERGALVGVLDRNPPDVASRALFVECDITDSTVVDASIRTVVEEFGQLDVLVNNAGIGASGDIAANSEDEWRRLFDVNVLGAARVTRAALPYLRASSNAAIVNICSVLAFMGVPNRALYSATKGAVAALTLATAADFVREGIRVNAVAPGTTDTPWIARLLEQAESPAGEAAALRARQPIGRLVSAAEVAFAVASLASPLAASTTGTVLAVDGGFSGLRLPK